MLNRAVFSSKSDHWSTPTSIYSKLDAEFGFNFDPCPLMSASDGAKIKWSGRVFCNPPYSKIKDFLRRGLYHLALHDCEFIVYLIPARTDTAWFHDYCYGKAELRFLRGRLRFGGATGNAPFPSMLAIFREWDLGVFGMLP